MARTKKHSYLHYTVLGVLFLFLFLIQYTGLFPPVYGARPLLLVSATIAAAMFLRQWAGAVFGLVAGMLMDAVVGGAGCFNTVVLLIFGCVSGLLITCLFNNTLGVSFLFQAGLLLLYVTLRWLIYYLLPGYDDAGYLFLKYGLGEFVYTFVLSIPLYLLIRRLLRQVQA